jgi:hypothetical protein
MVNTIAKIHISIAKYYKKLPKPRWKYIWPFQDWKPHLIILRFRFFEGFGAKTLYRMQLY